jgi:3-oxoacyl-[acyl-carrier-protein] synthase-3
MTNQDLEKLVETNDRWIVERTGIRERHILDEGMATSDMAIAAAQCALSQRGIEASEIEAIIVCTVTPDMMFPSTACLVQNGLGARGAWGFDLIAACSGFVFGTTTAACMVAAGTHRKVLVIGADTMSRILDYTDRSTCVLFGDAAGAVIVEATEEGEDAGLSISWGRSTAQAAISSRCRRGAAAFRRRMKPSTGASILCIRRGSRYSGMLSAKCMKPAATCSRVTASPATISPS